MVKVGKVLICGMKGVGKTAIIEQLICGNITPDSELHPTIEDTYVASIDTGRGARDLLRIFDTAGLQGNIQLPRQYFQLSDAFVLVYDPSDPASLDILAGVKSDIEKCKDKKEMIVIVVANMHMRGHRGGMDPAEAILNRANIWCARERFKHYVVNAMERASLYEPFISLAARIHVPQTKSAFPQLSKLTQKNSLNY
ncbi:NF-kappa-B inhibitor-interacting Ras-like protein [Phlebotomus argentipes]|uniref:NF-kappa-B inhibitor-interacting Ras-like protein n=1 Tax=Phlebotomus argentipes TaxID=94469 RepID=UPI002892F9A2|nr:NF-kappa-B inhibitor-interacting Ras-like protein [Phlebotomus argentipes]